MLMAHPAILNDLVERHEAIAAPDMPCPDTATWQRRNDLAYALCLSSGTSNVDVALVAARHHLPGALPTDDSLLQV